MLEVIPIHHHDKKIDLSCPENPTKDDLSLLIEETNKERRKQPNIVLRNIIHSVLDGTDIPTDRKKEVSDLIAKKIQNNEGARLPRRSTPNVQITGKPSIKTHIIDYKMRQAGDDTFK